MINLISKIYHFIWDKDSSRTADIIFNAVSVGKFEFIRCDYKTVCTTYDLDDWEFLGDLAKEIKKLAKGDQI